VVEQGAATPGAPGFALSGFGNPSLAGGNVAFQATSFESGPPGPMPPAIRSGIYTDVGGGLARVVDTGIATPGAPGFAFSGFGNPSLAGGNVAFQAMSAQAGPPGPMPPLMRSGIYTDIGGLTLVADTGVATPDAPGFTFVGFGDPSLAGDDVVFRAASTSPVPPGPFPPMPTMVEGLYIEINGILEKILDTNDLLDGKAIAGFAFGTEGFDGNSLAFVVSFRDFSFAVYRADIASVSVPIPGTLVLLGAALAAMLTARRRGRGF
jgi:hypothetical protein